jgi:serine/threonine protein kinase
MPTVYCPNCSSLVAQEGTLCPTCGTNLDFTPTEYRTPTGADAPAREPLDFPPGHTFAKRYTIIERVGAGGMGMVYKAIDTVLDDEICLKLIQPALARMPEFIERFLREVKLTRQITHPNIGRVYDIGQEDDALFLSMEWIEGETLQELLRKTGVLREARALQIAEKIALALGAAHDRGIVHRDLKPANVMVDRQGNVHVVDFGLALEPEARDITEVGVLVGTPNYMAPEQRARSRVDARADFYALGLILREMLTGERMDPSPALPPEARERINPVVIPVLERLMAERPEDRYDGPDEIVTDIRELLDDPAISTTVSALTPPPGASPLARRLGIGVALAALVVVAVVLWAVWPAAPHDRSFATPDARAWYERGMHYLGEAYDSGMGAKDAINMFNRASNLDPDHPLIWAGLGEAYWLQFRRSGKQLFRGEAERAVAKAIEIAPDLPEALNVRAIGFITEGKFEAARTDLLRVLTLDAESPDAWCNLGIVHQESGDYTAGLEALHKALELQPSSFRFRVNLGLFHQHFGEYAEASQHYRKATELKPDSSLGWNNLGASLLYAGKPAEAIEPFLEAIRIDDRAEARSNLGTSYYFLERYVEAEEQYLRATELEPGAAVHWGNLGDVLHVQGKDAEAREAYAEAARRAAERTVLEPLNPGARRSLARYCAKAGDEACALEESRMAQDLQPDSVETTLTAAIVRCTFGLDDECLDLLDQAVKHGLPRASIEAAPEFDRLVDDPRFRSILDQAG